MTTTPSYHRDGYLRSLTTYVDDVGVADDGRLYLVLEDTVAYPQGGGQRGDRGSVAFPDDDIITLPFVDTRNARLDDGERETRHYLDPAANVRQSDLYTGMAITVDIDWEHRLNQMRLHAGVHLIHCFIEQQLGDTLPQPQLSDLVGPTHAVNRYDDVEINQSVVSAAVAELNAFARTGVPITTKPVDGGRPGERVWVCGDWTIGCGGVHVSNTRELPPLSAVTTFKKNRTTVTLNLITPTGL